MNDMIFIFLILALGYLLGRMKIWGLQLGASGVLLVALVFGHFGVVIPSSVKEIGLVLFVTSVGFVAGPVFFRNFKAKAFQYVTMGILVIFLGTGVCVAIIKIFHISTPLAAGLLSGALTSTPGLAAAMEASGDALASIGYGIAYPFGVVGVVLFVQIIPKVLKADLRAEAKKLDVSLMRGGESRENQKPLVALDSFGFVPLSAAVALGMLIAKIGIPLPGGAVFSLGASGAPLLVGLIFGHFGHAGPISFTVPPLTLKPVRELGLGMFLLGAGTEAGHGFVAVLAEHGAMLFVFGALMTVIPLVSYFVARHLLKMDLLHTLGSICGGMTSTPALGALISAAGSDVVTTSYAAAYPIALAGVVLACQLVCVFI